MFVMEYHDNKRAILLFLLEFYFLPFYISYHTKLAYSEHSYFKVKSTLSIKDLYQDTKAVWGFLLRRELFDKGGCPRRLTRAFLLV